MATALTLKKLYPFEMSDLDLARCGQMAEHHFTGVKCGLLDQLSVLCGKAGHATTIDCRSMELRHVPLGADTVFVIIHSGAKHALTSGEYNERRASCEEAAHLLGKKALRDVSSAELDAAAGFCQSKCCDGLGMWWGKMNGWLMRSRVWRRGTWRQWAG
ncbi:MAG: hypothetical protein HC904_10400 [Blastochloris sp.]|nr:hypothetical protein [Blastochloris sp.]